MFNNPIARRRAGVFSLFAILIALIFLSGCERPVDPTPTPVDPTPTTTPDPYPVGTPTPGPYPEPSPTPDPYTITDPDVSFGIPTFTDLYFPIVGRDQWQACDTDEAGQIDRGIAWLPGRHERAVTDWCAYWYYNSARNVENYEPGQLAMLWSNRIGDVELAERIADVGDCRPVLVLNEPNLHEQANLSLGDATEAIVNYDRMLPCSELVIGNVFVRGSNGEGLDYLDELVRRTRNVEARAIGVHFYFAADGQDLGPLVDEVCGIVLKHRPVCNLWVTEFGVHDQPNQYDNMRCWSAQLLAHPNIERVFAYTVDGAQNAVPFLDNKGKITPVGSGWLDGVRLVNDDC